MSKDMCGELVTRCFQARTDAHIAHLMTRSYAAHVALNEFYDGIVGLADGFAEMATGRYGILTYPQIMPRHKDANYSKPESIPTGLRAWIDSNRAECCDDSELQNTIDEIISLCDSTIYKLKFLS